MFEAEVGDDGLGEDPTVNYLEDRTAKMFQKEAAVFLPSCTMSNLAATMSWCNQRGSELLLGDKSRMFLLEEIGSSQVANVYSRTLPNDMDGSMSLDAVEKSISPDNINKISTTSMIAVENTHNYCGGRVLSLQYLENLYNLAKMQNIPIHIDGSRIWNAATYQQKSVAEICQYSDSASICLSKGLGAPAGSVLVGPKDFIDRARRARKVLGGTMRQSGVLAAAGLVALDDYEAGILSYDHIRAQYLATKISEMAGFSVDKVETNLILVKLAVETLDATTVINMLKDKGILAYQRGTNRIRLVTHRDISDVDVNIVIDAFRDISVQMYPRPITTAPPQERLIDIQKLEREMSELKSLEELAEPVPAVEQESTEPYHEEAVIHGMSVSDDGFCVFLRGLICDRVFRLLVTPSDPMSDGLDRDRVETSEAVTLLQLLQGIDVESHLSGDALFSRMVDDMNSDYNRKQQLSLRRVIIDIAESPKFFLGKLCATTTDFLDPIYDNGSNDGLVEYQADGNDKSEDFIEGESSYCDKIVETKNAFELIGLALRHNAIIEIRSDYFQNEKLSYRVEELSKYFPKLIEADSSMYRRETSDFNKFEMERLQRQLFEAIRQGNSNKINEIKRQLEFYSTIEGRSVYIDPPQDDEKKDSSSSLSSDSSQSVPDDNYDTFIGNRSSFY